MRFSISILQFFAKPGVPGGDDEENDDGADEDQVAHRSNPLPFSSATGRRRKAGTGVSCILLMRCTAHIQREYSAMRRHLKNQYRPRMR
jgi:hypothetical protein